ncbi:MAG: hypothetical protein ISN28_04790 [Ectothiorhodospiraceae bacterium AqS1]|nr:hypothetical protein [Ectothiorhodospiraceae bacterium AqS1]
MTSIEEFGKGRVDLWFVQTDDVIETDFEDEIMKGNHIGRRRKNRLAFQSQFDQAIADVFIRMTRRGFAMRNIAMMERLQLPSLFSPRRRQTPIPLSSALTARWWPSRRIAREIAITTP